MIGEKEAEVEYNVAVPNTDLLKYLIIQKRDNVLLNIQKYNDFSYMGAKTLSNKLRSSVMTLFLSIKASMKRDKKEIEGFEDRIKTSVKEAIAVFEIIDDYLDYKKVTRFDTSRFRKTFNAELSNLEKNL